MKALMNEIGEIFLDCVPAGAIISMLLALLSGGAVRDAVIRFAESVC